MKLSQARCILLAALAAAVIAAPAAAQKPFLDVGKQPPITILINSSPWYGGFEKTVELYEKQTGNKVKLDITPFDGVLEKARNAVRGERESLRPAQSRYAVDHRVLRRRLPHAAEGHRSGLRPAEGGADLRRLGLLERAQALAHADGGKLMAFHAPRQRPALALSRGPAQAGGPRAAEDLGRRARVLRQAADPPKRYAVVIRGERGNGIRFEWMVLHAGPGRELVKDPENGDFTVTINSPQAKAALDLFIELCRNAGRPTRLARPGRRDPAAGRRQGRAAQVVSAAWANFEDPDKSAVVGKVDAAGAAGPGRQDLRRLHRQLEHRGAEEIPEAQKKAALAFSRWFLTEGAQHAYAEAGWIPVRSDIFEELGSNPKFRWMPAYLRLQIAVQSWATPKARRSSRSSACASTRL